MESVAASGASDSSACGNIFLFPKPGLLIIVDIPKVFQLFKNNPRNA